MAETPTLATSRAYAAIQTVLLAIYAAVLLCNPGPALLVSHTATLAGNVLAVVGLATIALGFVALGRNIQVSPHAKEGAHLVQTGIYRVLRHPIYTGIALCVVALWLREPTLAAAIAGIVVIGFLGAKRRLEERFLLAVYPGYAEYRKRTLAFP